MTNDLPQFSRRWPEGPSLEEALSTEWLVTNGIGGYSFGTLATCNTRRYHGYFTPSLPGLGRVVLLARIGEVVHDGQKGLRIDTEEPQGIACAREGLAALREFRLEGMLPSWEYAIGETRLSREVVWRHGKNTLVVRYRHLSGPPVTLDLRPWPVFRLHDRPLAAHAPMPKVRPEGRDWRLQLADDAPPFWMRLHSHNAAEFIAEPEHSLVQHYQVEQRRGYEHQETQESPGYFRCALGPRGSVALMCTAEGPDGLSFEPDTAFAAERQRQLGLLERAPEALRKGTPGRLVLAADSYIIDPISRPETEERPHSRGGEARSVIAGYPWFTDWGRDTMISLEGLTLCTGRADEARAILRTFRLAVRDGLLPNLYPEGEEEGLYHTADATLWFFHAIDRYLEHTKDRALLEAFWPTLENIIEHHQKGTRFNIGVDPADGLLRQGEEGYQLTWMDAKVDGWVVTPRRGKAVELNALYFNALSLMTVWAEALGRDPTAYARAAQRVKDSFNQRFWNERRGCLYDVIDVEGLSGAVDEAIRPNQVFAIALPHPVLEPKRWKPVMQRVDEHLLTPVGLRSLAPGHPHYRSHYDGDLRSRDAAYHQGTIWGWLIGPYVSARLRTDEDKEQAKAALSGLIAHLDDGCIGQAAEIFDATAPFEPRGCVAQAWSIAELLRAWVEIDGA